MYSSGDCTGIGFLINDGSLTMDRAVSVGRILTVGPVKALAAARKASYVLPVAGALILPTMPEAQCVGCTYIIVSHRGSNYMILAVLTALQWNQMAKEISCW
jgi:hypothetical protein